MITAEALMNTIAARALAEGVILTSAEAYRPVDSSNDVRFLFKFIKNQKTAYASVEVKLDTKVFKGFPKEVVQEMLNYDH